MKRFKNILLVCNFEVKEHIAVQRAVLLAKQNEAYLTVISVVKALPMDVSMAITIMQPQELMDLAIKNRQKQIDALVADMNQQGINASVQLVIGTPFIEVIRQVLRNKHDLVIMAAEGKRGIMFRLFGSTSMHLMRKCPCPVWVVKATGHANYKRVLAAVDLTSDFPDPEHESLNPLILQLASSMAKTDKSELHVVQVWSVFAEGYMEGRGGMSKNSIQHMRKQVKQQYEMWLDHLLASVSLIKFVTRKHLLRNDNAPKAIVKLAKNKKIDLLVLGTVCRTSLAGFFIGNTAEKVLSEVNCSVLTVKPKGFVTPVTLEDT